LAGKLSKIDHDLIQQFSGSSQTWLPITTYIFMTRTYKTYTLVLHSIKSVFYIDRTGIKGKVHAYNVWA